MKTIDQTKERLLKHIESIESLDFLEVIEEIVFHISRENDDFELSESDILELERRRDDYLSGKDKGITFEEVKARIFDRYGF
jgi:putative addiction module component (TIGR02574 family)